jgi:uncharacterized membrane protein YcjF (UPF0283 family)
MSSPPTNRPIRLVDMEFKPGELPAAEAEPMSLNQIESLPRRNSGIGFPARLAFGSAVAIFLLVIVNAAVSLLLNVVQAGNLMDMAFLVALLALVGSTGWLIAQQTRALRKLKSAERARELAVHLARLDGAGSGARLLGALQSVYVDNPAVRAALNAAASGLQPHHSDRDAIELLNREIFALMDREADERIQRAALRATLGVSSCPHPALDALVVLAISVMLIRDLMRVYGLRHSARSLYRVMTRALFTASTTAVMSTVVEFAMKAAQDRLAAAVVGTAGEALVVARRMFALGALAKAEIRPLPAS